MNILATFRLSLNMPKCSKSVKKIKHMIADIFLIHAEMTLNLLKNVLGIKFRIGR